MTRVGGYAAREAGSLKEAQQALVSAVGGLDAAIDLARVGRSQMQRYTSGNDDDRFTNMPVDIVLRLEEAAGRPIVSAYMLHHQRYLAVPADQTADADSYHRQLCALGTRVAEFFSEAHAALDDGMVTPREAGAMKRQTLRIAETLGAFTARLNRIIRSGKPERGGRA